MKKVPTANGTLNLSEVYMTHLIDPTKKYPKLDIPEQRQSEPGLDRALEPLADHGQHS